MARRQAPAKGRLPMRANEGKQLGGVHGQLRQPLRKQSPPASGFALRRAGAVPRGCGSSFEEGDEAWIRVPGEILLLDDEV